MQRPKWDIYPLFEKQLADLLPTKTKTILIACSGGPDSIVLWDLAERWGEGDPAARILVGHLDHGLRGRASRGDAAFVAREAARRGTPVHIVRVDVRGYARKHKLGLEEAGRLLRYRALAAVARREGCGVVLAAHHLNDQAETFFLNLVRGTGPAGLAAMAPLATWPVPVPRPAPLLARPLLDVSREDILSYARARGLRFRTDASNASPAFARNRLRPLLRRLERERPGLLQRLARLAAVQRDEEAFWRAEVRLASPRLFRRKGAALSLDRAVLNRYHVSLQRRLLRQAVGLPDFSSIERVRALSLAGQGGPVLFRGGRAVLKGRRLLIRRGGSAPS